MPILDGDVDLISPNIFTQDSICLLILTILYASLGIVSIREGIKDYKVQERLTFRFCFAMFATFFMFYRTILWLWPGVPPNTALFMWFFSYEVPIYLEFVLYLLSICFLGRCLLLVQIRSEEYFKKIYLPALIYASILFIVVFVFCSKADPPVSVLEADGKVNFVNSIFFLITTVPLFILQVHLQKQLTKKAIHTRLTMKRINDFYTFLWIIGPIQILRFLNVYLIKFNCNPISDLTQNWLEHQKYEYYFIYYCLWFFTCEFLPVFLMITYLNKVNETGHTIGYSYTSF
eukprot:TRINITY_DN2373_c0_g1_i1.p1 TRINITY_DN2373_c0_g1~~TRINITY_DN2373_c0_g1_i1.p1  ORF type:complete len:289 (+),score=45.99 TRINITY_DN2373_c0_g1_i1:66-932(+)